MAGLAGLSGGLAARTKTTAVHGSQNSEIPLNAAPSILLLSLKLNVIGWIAEVDIKIHKTMTKVSSMNFNVNLCNSPYNSQFFSPVLKCGCL